MWNNNKKAPILEFLSWVLLSLTSEVILLLLEPCSILYMIDGKLTVEYVIIAC